MSNELTPEETKKILDALDNAVATGPWTKSIFLRAIGAKLENIRDEFKASITTNTVKTSAHLANRVALRSGQQEVFVSLYNATGNDIKQWERIIANLTKQSVSRPTYSSERDVLEMIRSRPKKENEAYVSIYVNQSDIAILPPDKIPRDRLGIALLTLRDRAIKQENIMRFYHKSGQYVYENGRLIRQGDIETADFR